MKNAFVDQNENLLCRFNVLKRSLIAMVFFMLALSLAGVANAKPADSRSMSFNHTATGFFLDGAHARLTCESCHTKGLFRGTPRDCATCHRPGDRAPGKTATHILTNAPCSSCHKTISWAPSDFRHRIDQGVVQGGCSTCHNGSSSIGKPSTHIATMASCDSCHKSSSWLPAGYNHASVVPGSCATCHNGTRATGKNASHIPTTASCDACHTAGVAFAPISVSMTAMHANMKGPVAAGNCSSCHNGSFLSQNAQTKPVTHVSTTAQCDTCHSSTTTWANATFDHAAAVPAVTGRCSSCHNGSAALGKPTNHIPTAAQCDTCHSGFVAFKPAQMNHAGTVGQCSTCHSGSYLFANALAKPATHIPTTSQCDSCHTKGFITWSPSVMNHTGLAGQCSTCHNGAYLSQNAQSKTPTHMATTAQCDTCHNSTVSWATASMNHATASPPVAGRCATCHNGTAALGKPTNHIPTTAQCDTCHTGFVAFAPGLMNHAGTTGPVAAGNCATCHSGAYVAINAQVKGAKHIPTTQSCDVCHSTSVWKPTTFTHAGVVAGSCATCHNGTSASGKSTPHIPTTQSCDACHRTGLAWLPLITPYSHSGVATTGCATCHTSPYTNIDVKPANHLPTTASCESCHHSFANWLPTTFNHVGVVAGTCQTCHGGTYANIVIKPSNHIPTITPSGMPGNECSLCHSSTTSFAVEKMNHGTMQTSCITCHDSTSTYLGGMTKVNRSRHNNAGVKDCSTSGCHKPLGNKGSTYVKWD